MERTDRQKDGDYSGLFCLKKFTLDMSISLHGTCGVVEKIVGQSSLHRVTGQNDSVPLIVTPPLKQMTGYTGLVGEREREGE